MKSVLWRPLAWASITLVVLVGLAAACAPAVTPTPAPAKTQAAASPTPAPKVEATKPAEKAPATPTTVASKPAGKPIRVAYLTPLTGRAAAYGQLQKLAVQMALEDINKAGGINGAPLEIIREDSPFDPKQAVSLVNKVVEQDKALMIFGPFSSGEFEVAAPLANQLQVPLINSVTGKAGIPAANRPWVFKSAMTEDKMLAVGVDALKKRYPDVKRVLIVGDVKEAVNESIVKTVFPKLLKDAGFEVIDTLGFESGTTDFSPIITKIKEIKPDAIAYSSIGAEFLAFGKEIERQGVRIPGVTGTQAWAGPFIKQLGSAVDGWIVIGTLDKDDPDPAVKAWVARFDALKQADSGIAAKDTPTTLEIHIYDTMMAVADIMRKANVTADMPLQEARTKIRDGFQNLKNYKGVRHTISITSTGDVEWQPLAFPLIAEKGGWKPLK